jgi:hypothetical protein
VNIIIKLFDNDQMTENPRSEKDSGSCYVLMVIMLHYITEPLTKKVQIPLAHRINGFIYLNSVLCLLKGLKIECQLNCRR